MNYVAVSRGPNPKNGRKGAAKRPIYQAGVQWVRSVQSLSAEVAIPGTRVFNEILTLGGVFTGIKRVTKWPDSEDLKIINLLSRWVLPYVNGELNQRELAEMRQAFLRQLRWYFPGSQRAMGFQEPADDADPPVPQRDVPGYEVRACCA